MLKLLVLYSVVLSTVQRAFLQKTSVKAFSNYNLLNHENTNNENVCRHIINKANEVEMKNTTLIGS